MNNTSVNEKSDLVELLIYVLIISGGLSMGTVYAIGLADVIVSDQVTIAVAAMPCLMGCVVAFLLIRLYHPEKN